MRDSLILLVFCFVCYPRLLAQQPSASIEGTVVNSITGAPLSGAHLKLALENPDEIVAPVYGASGDPLTVELGTAGAGIAGTVSDANGPIAGALVALFPEGRYAPDRSCGK